MSDSNDNNKMNHSDGRSPVFQNGFSDQYNDKSYALSGRIMLSAIVILFFVVVVMVCLHLYARWYLFRARRRHNLRRNRRNRNQLVFHVDNNNHSAANRGLDDSVLNSLPVFVYKTLADDSAPVECAVCLSEFEESETGRRLPKCNHCFHIECIDMWFHSHSTCPLCRTPVEPSSEPDVIVQIGEPETGSGSEEARPAGLCSVCEGENSSFSSSAAAMEDRRKKKPVSVSIDVPRRNESFGRGGADDESSSSTSFRSPMSRVLSFKSRMLSSFRSPRETTASTPTPATASSSTVNELDLERGKERTQ